MGKIIFEFLDDPGLTKNTYSNDLSILIGVDRFSFLISDPQQNVVLLKSYDYPQPIGKNYPLVNGIREICLADPLLTAAYQKTRIGLFNTKNTLIPEALFDPEQLQVYLRNIFAVPATDQLLADRLSPLGLRNLFAFNTEIKNALETFFPKALFVHAQTPVLLGMQKLTAVDNSQVFINVQQGFLQVLAFAGKNLLYNNSFQFKNTSDFVYYVLLIYNQFQFKPETVPLTIAGTLVEDSEIYHLLYRFIRHLNMVQVPDYYSFPERLRQEPLHLYFDLFSLKLCE